MSGKIIGLMMSRNEEDIIGEVLFDLKQRQGFDAVYALDSSDDHTFEVLKSYDFVHAFRDRDFGLNLNTIRDGHREFMLRKIVEDHGYGNWIFCLNADEIYHSPVKETLDKINISDFNLLWSLIATFVFHQSEVGEVEKEDPGVSIEKRRLWYFCCAPEPRAFVNAPGMEYRMDEKRRGYPHWGDDHLYSNAPFLLFVKNYPARTPAQFLDRIKDRGERDWAPPYLHFLPGLYIRSLEGVFDMWKNPDVYPAPLQKFDGRFRLHVSKQHFWDKIPGSSGFAGPPVKSMRGD